MDENEISQLQQQIDEALEKSRKKPNGIWAKYAKLAMDSPSTLKQPEDEDGLTAQFVVAENLEVLTKILKEGHELEACQSNIVEELRPTASSLGLTESFGLTATSGDDEQPKHEPGNQLKEDDTELRHSDIDDDEIDSYILNDREASVKRVLWEKLNSDWMQEMREKEKVKAEQEADRKEKEAHGELPPKKKRRIKKRPPIQANSAGEAIEKMLHEKRISNKINYDVLRQLSKPAASLANPMNKTSTVDSAPAAPVETTPIKRLPSIRNHVSLSDVRLSRSLSKSPATNFKFQADSATRTETDKRKSTPAHEEVVIVEEAPTNKVVDVVDDLDEDDEPVADEQMSITQLMSKRMSSTFASDGHDVHDVRASDYEDDY